MEPSGNRQLRARFPISGCAIRPTPVSSRCLSTGAKQGGGAATASQLYCNARLATGSALLQCASGVHSFHLLLARSAKAARHACFASGIHEDARPGCVCHPQLTATGSLTMSRTLATYHPQVATVASPRPRPDTTSAPATRTCVACLTGAHRSIAHGVVHLRHCTVTDSPTVP